MGTYMSYDRREHETYPESQNEGAVLYIIDGKKRWVPKSVIEEEDDSDKVVIIQDWWARDKGIKSDW